MEKTPPSNPLKLFIDSLPENYLEHWVGGGGGGGGLSKTPPISRTLPNTNKILFWGLVDPVFDYISFDHFHILKS